MLQQTGQEIVPLLLVARRPSLFGKCQGARKHHVLHLCLSGDSLAPDVSLHAFNQLQLLLRQIGGHDVARVEGFQGVVVLRVVEVAKGGGAEDNFVATVGRALYHIGMVAAPPVDGCRLADTTLQDFVPADELLAILIEILLHGAGKPRLQLRLVL